MIVFWVAAALLSVAVAVLIVLRAARAADHVPAEDPTLNVYRRQLSEIEDLADRGLLAQDERRSARTEAARRLLAAADTQAPKPEGGRNRVLVIALAGTAPLIALGLYLLVGSPQTPDQPFAARLKAWRADPAGLDADRMAAVLQQVAAEHPRDPEPLVYLSHADLVAGDFVGAEAAARKAIALQPGRGELWGILGEILTQKAGQDGDPEAIAAFRRAAALDAKLPGPRYYLARAQMAGGDVQGGLKAWRALSADLPASDPRHDVLVAQIAAVEKKGFLPSAQAAAPQVDQQAMIGAMVARLAGQLAMQPDNPQGWGRLIRSYTILGDEPKRQAALARAQALFKDHPDAWKQVEDAMANAQ
jgi:cytochrome c-type biogenesis protein CcmH